MEADLTAQEKQKQNLTPISLGYRVVLGFIPAFKWAQTCLGPLQSIAG